MEGAIFLVSWMFLTLVLRSRSVDHGMDGFVEDGFVAGCLVILFYFLFHMVK